MKSCWIATALLTVAGAAGAANPHVWFDTDRGPILLELDAERAPLTTAHFAQIVDEKFYDGQVFYRTIPNFVIQAGRINQDGTAKTRNPNPTVASESGNGLPNVPGAIAMALISGNRNSGTVEFFINTTTNAHLDADFTVFGQVVYGMPTVNAIGNAATHSGTTLPFRPTVIRRAVTSDGFPIMPLHSGSWYDPANDGRGIALEVSTVPGGDGTPLVVVYWYDYFEGRQVWMTGAAPFEFGATEVQVPLKITEGGQFGDAFDPGTVVSNPDFGTITVRFSGCASGSFDYATAFGNGTLELVRLTIPDGDSCSNN